MYLSVGMRLLNENLDPLNVRRSEAYWNLSEAYFAAKGLPGIVGRVDFKVYGGNLVMAVSTGWGGSVLYGTEDGAKGVSSIY